MNPICFICDSPATRVCKHPQCSELPYLCSGPCIKMAAQKIHTHNNQQHFIELSLFQNKVHQYNNKLDPQILHKQYFEKIEKQILIVKERIDQQLHELLQRHKKDLNQVLLLKLNSKTSNFIGTHAISTSKGIQITGEEINYLMKGWNIFENQQIKYNAIQSIKKSFSQTLQYFMQDFCGQYVSIEKKFYSYQEYEQLPYNYLQSLAKVNDFDDDLYYVLGKKAQQIYNQQEDSGCPQQGQYQQGQSQQDNYNQEQDVNNSESVEQSSYFSETEVQMEDIERYYLKSLELNPVNRKTIIALGEFYIQNCQFDKGVQIYTNAFKIDQQLQNSYSNPGDCCSEIGQTKQSFDDYILAYKKSGLKNQFYLQKILQIQNLLSQNQMDQKFKFQKRERG